MASMVILVLVQAHLTGLLFADRTHGQVLFRDNLHFLSLRNMYSNES